MKEVIEKALLCVLRDLYSVDSLPEGTRIEVPREENHGDLATNVAFLLAKRLKKNPTEVAGTIAQHLEGEKLFEEVNAIKGFINFRLSRDFYREELKKVLSKGEEYFKTDLGKRQKVQLEFVSANPTGPLHLGHGRGAVVGDVLARVMSFLGAEVTREYYINDAGRQVYLLGLSILYRYNELLKRDDLNSDIKEEFEKEGYKGQYVIELAKLLASIVGDILTRSEVKRAWELLSSSISKGSGYLKLFDPERDSAIDLCSLFGLDLMMKEIRQDLADLGVTFDTWFSERDMRERGEVEKIIKELTKKGYTYESEGALWLKTSELGDDKDRVLRKSDGELTYFASDIAYHLDKFRRGFDRVIDLWGSDHFGYIKRVKSALQMLGIEEEWLEVYIVQTVRLFKGGKEIKMSKRSGKFVTLRELMNEVGSDAVRFIFLTRRSDTPLDFNIDLVKEKSSDNPVFYVQYAHARIAGVFREFKKRFGIEPLKAVERADLGKLALEQEIRLIKKVISLKDELISTYTGRDPHLLVYYLIGLASEFHNYYNHNRIIGAEEPIMLARLALLNGIRISLSLGLKLIGVSAPERM